MARWLFKEEPENYSYATLEKDGHTFWSGIANPLALKNLRQVTTGDEIFFYHTGKEKAIVGVMIAAADATEDASSKQLGVMVKPVRRLETPVRLAQIKADSAFKDWELTRLPRLSIMPVTASQWRAVMAMAKA